MILINQKDQKNQIDKFHQDKLINSNPMNHKHNITQEMMHNFNRT